MLTMDDLPIILWIIIHVHYPWFILKSVNWIAWRPRPPSSNVQAYEGQPIKY